MPAFCVLLVLLALASVTDIRRHWISNWNTYPGMLLGLIINCLGFGWLGHGWEGLQTSLVGFLACGGLMLVAFVFFDMGGGDVKLMAMVGAFLGLESGIEVVLWTFSLGFVLGMAVIIWQVGVAKLLGAAFEHLRLVTQAKGWVPLTPLERQPLQRGLFLAPSAFLAAALVGYRHLMG